MGLRTKFNLVLLVVFAAGIVGSGYVSYELLQNNAREEVTKNAGIMMAAALAARDYTVKQVRPHIEAMNSKKFLPQTVPSYAATEVFNKLRSLSYPDYMYKEATLNPTNPRDRAVDWESDIVTHFRDKADATEMSGERDTPMGRFLYLARPIKIASDNCLECHSTPAAAPKSMVQLYGDSNGFGWKLNEIVGAQVVSVPMQIAINRANETFRAFMASLVAVFAALFITLNIMLTQVVIKPISKLSKLADEMSTGKASMTEFPVTGNDEVSKLASSFNRMSRSLEKAMNMLDK